MKLCKDCKDCEYYAKEYCKKSYVDVVTGELVVGYNCYEIRGDEIKCGASARLFEAKEELESNLFRLRTYIDASGYLAIVYYDGWIGKRIGYINEDGECHIMNSQDYRENWETWKENGSLVDSTPVKWRGKQYNISSDRMLKSSVCFGDFIFNFEDGMVITGCEDDNIQRLSNGTPINY